MTTTTLAEPGGAQLKDVLDGLPRDLLSRRAFDQVARFALRLDVLGRVDADTGAPLIEAETLRGLLLETVPAPLANRLIELLAELPGSAFIRHVHPAATEVSWFELASRVTILDPDPGATFGELGLSTRAGGAEIVAAVQARFPSMEPELIEPDNLPPKLRTLIEDGDGMEVVLRQIVRQLGWWAALTTVLLAPAAMMSSGDDADTEPGHRQAVWPLWMYLVCAAVGGWTLTVVGSWILAPRD